MNVPAMENMDKYAKQIIDYLFNDMGALEREAFEERIKGDPAMASEVARQKKIMDDLRGMLAYKEAMEDPHRDEAERVAEEILASREEEKIPRIRINKRKVFVRLLYAATIVLAYQVLNNLSLGLTPHLRNQRQKSIENFKIHFKALRS